MRVRARELVKQRHTHTPQPSGGPTMSIMPRSRARTAALVVTTLALLAIIVRPAAAAGTDTWVAGPSMEYQRGDHTATLLPDGDVLAVAGTQWQYDWATTERYDAQTQTWSAAANLIEPRQMGYTATTLKDGRVLVAGGNNYWGSMNRAEIYDPATNSWTETHLLNAPRWMHTAARLNDGRVLVAFGWGEDGSRDPQKTAEIFDPKTNEWKSVAPAPAVLFSPEAIVLPSGLVVVTGSHRDGTGRTLIYNPIVDRWTEGAQMPEQREEHTATLLTDGTVLVSGGTYQDAFYRKSDAEIYDPLLDRWTRVASPAPDLVGATDTRLVDGRVLFAGEVGTEGATLLFNPKSQTWTQAPNSLDRQRPVATLLADGRVMLSGSLYLNGYTTEIFDAADTRSERCKSLPVCLDTP